VCGGKWKKMGDGYKEQRNEGVVVGVDVDAENEGW
jgi:hypothetical protein